MARSIDQPIVPPPWMRISWIGNVRASDSAAAGRSTASARRCGSRRQQRTPITKAATTRTTARTMSGLLTRRNDAMNSLAAA